MDSKFLTAFIDAFIKENINLAEYTIVNHDQNLNGIYEYYLESSVEPLILRITEGSIHETFVYYGSSEDNVIYRLSDLCETFSPKAVSDFVSVFVHELKDFNSESLDIICVSTHLLIVNKLVSELRTKNFSGVLRTSCDLHSPVKLTLMVNPRYNFTLFEVLTVGNQILLKGDNFNVNIKSNKAGGYRIRQSEIGKFVSECCDKLLTIFPPMTKSTFSTFDNLFESVFVQIGSEVQYDTNKLSFKLVNDNAVVVYQTVSKNDDVYEFGMDYDGFQLSHFVVPAKPNGVFDYNDLAFNLSKDLFDYILRIYKANDSNASFVLDNLHKKMLAGLILYSLEPVDNVSIKKLVKADKYYTLETMNYRAVYDVDSDSFIVSDKDSELYRISTNTLEKEMVYDSVTRLRLKDLIKKNTIKKWNVSMLDLKSLKRIHNAISAIAVPDRFSTMYSDSMVYFKLPNDKKIYITNDEDITDNEFYGLIVNYNKETKTQMLIRKSPDSKDKWGMCNEVATALMKAVFHVIVMSEDRDDLFYPNMGLHTILLTLLSGTLLYGTAYIDDSDEPVGILTSNITMDSERFYLSDNGRKCSAEYFTKTDSFKVTLDNEIYTIPKKAVVDILLKATTIEGASLSAEVLETLQVYLSNVEPPKNQPVTSTPLDMHEGVSAKKDIKRKKSVEAMEVLYDALIFASESYVGFRCKKCTLSNPEDKTKSYKIKFIPMLSSMVSTSSALYKELQFQLVRLGDKIKVDCTYGGITIPLVNDIWYDDLVGWSVDEVTNVYRSKFKDAIKSVLSVENMQCNVRFELAGCNILTRRLKDIYPSVSSIRDNSTNDYFRKFIEVSNTSVIIEVVTSGNNYTDGELNIDILNGELNIEIPLYSGKLCNIHHEEICYFDDAINKGLKRYANVVEGILKERDAQNEEASSSTSSSDFKTSSITKIRLVSLRHEDELVGFRFKTNIGNYDISLEVAKSLGVASYKVSKTINLKDVNGVLMSKKEIETGKLCEDISSNTELVKELFDLVKKL